MVSSTTIINVSLAATWPGDWVNTNEQRWGDNPGEDGSLRYKFLYGDVDGLRIAMKW